MSEQTTAKFDLRSWLQKQPREMSVAIAARSALRAAPALTFPPQQAEASGAARNIAALLFAYFRAVAIAESGAMTIASAQAARAAAAAANGASEAATRLPGEVSATRTAIRAAAAAADSAASPDAAAAAREASAAVATASIAIAAACRPAAAEAANAFEDDLQALRSGADAAQLLARPLWPHGIPPGLAERWMRLKQDVLSVGMGFQVWLDWIEQRLTGGPLDIEIEKKLTVIPQEVLAQGPGAVNLYIRQQLADVETKPFKRVRAIFLGYGDAGKTSLIRALRGERVDEGDQEMTRGADVTTLLLRDPTVTGRTGANDDIGVYFWDFGGQVMVHHTHQFFLRSSCLYVVVLDGRRNEETANQARYWLEHVKAFGGDSPVMIVGNKIDLADVRLDLTSLKGVFPNIVGFFPLSAINSRKPGEYADKFMKFQRKFNDQIQRLLAGVVRFSDSEYAILDELQQAASGESFLRKGDFETICNRYGVDSAAADGKQRQELLLDLFDKLGIVMHFPEIRALDDLLLNPEWLTRGVYAIMYSNAAKSNRGHITFNQFAEVLTKASLKDFSGRTLVFDRPKANFVIEAMEKFRLCYRPNQSPNDIIIPALLNEEQPRHDYKFSSAWAFRFRFEGFMPQQVLPTLIVDRHEEIFEHQVWQFGARLKPRHYEADAFLQADSHNRWLTIWLRGREANDYLRILIDRVVNLALGKLDHISYFREVRLTPDMRWAGSKEYDVRERNEPVWAPYGQVRSHLRQRPDQPYIGPDELEYDLNKLEVAPAVPARSCLADGSHRRACR